MVGQEDLNESYLSINLEDVAYEWSDYTTGFSYGPLFTVKKDKEITEND